MMDFSGAVLWREEWQLRVLVLGSLIVQFMLFCAAAVRRCALPPLLRLLIWLAYLGGDAQAIYALATLFNRHNQGHQQKHHGSDLEVLWTPVLLIHLGGQHMMTAYSIEDNELWRRRAITVVSQVAVALYVFCRSWSGEKRLLQAAIMLFVVGIIRSIEKPLVMMNASVSNIVDAYSMSTRREKGFFPLCCRLAKCSFAFCFSVESITSPKEEGDEEEDMTLQDFVQEASKNLPKLANDQKQAQKLSERSDMVRESIFKLLVDISAPYSKRIKNLEVLMTLDFLHANGFLTTTLYTSFLFLYTKLPTILSGGSECCLHLCLPFLTLASFIIFSTNHKNHDHNATDVKVTYILLSCTTLLDFLLLLAGPCIVFVGLGREKVSQYNLLSFCSRKKHPTIMMMLATLVCCKDYVNMHCYIEHLPTSSSLEVLNLVHGYLKDAWKENIHDAISYKRFNNRRGQQTLMHQRHLRWSLKMSFDSSVLLWHIVTDLCFHHQSTTSRGHECATRSRVISNYMAYLLSIRPEMLMPGTRNNIFRVACDDVEVMLGLGENLPQDERGVAQGILVGAQRPLLGGANIIGALVPNACKLAKALMELGDERQRWEVVQGVWVEMLCYSASRCRGYMHAKHMNEGLELLSRVCFLMSFMGMETFADRFQKLQSLETQEDEDEEAVMMVKEEP